MGNTTQELGMELPWEVHEMDRWLKEGNPTWGWRGDPRLELRMGIVTAGKTGYYPQAKRWVREGDAVGYNWQVWRHNEDGTDKNILTRKGTELHTIIPALIEIDPRTPGFEPVMDRVEREDAILQKHRQADIADAVGQKMDHLWNLVADTQNGRTTFRGMPGRNPEKQL